MGQMKQVLAVFGALALLAGCAAQPAQNAADTADANACTAAANDAYNAQNYDQLSRPSQAGLQFPASPVQVFQAQQLGAEHARESQITNCERNGNTAQPVVNGVPVATPHIINNP
jgi:hypothetical protein